MSLLSKTDSTRVVLQYYLYRAVANPGFIQPIYILYLLFHDLTFAQIGVIGGFMYGVDPVYPFYTLLVMRFVPLGVVVTLPKNAQYSDNNERTEATEHDDEDQLTIVDALPIIRDRLASRELRAFVLFIALFSGAAGTTSAYVQPIAQEPLRSSLGALLDAYNLTEAASLVSGVLADYADPFVAVAAMGAAFLLAGFAIVSSTTIIHEPSTQTSNTVPAPE